MDLGLNLNLDTLKNKSTQNNLDDNINNSKSVQNDGRNNSFENITEEQTLLDWSTQMSVLLIIC